MKKNTYQKVSTEKKTFTDNTYSLAKALHFIDLAKQYFEDVQLGTNGEVKMIFSLYIQKCDWIIRNLKDRLSPENREILAKELEGSLDINAIMDKVIHLDGKQKSFIEDIIDGMIRGEEVIIVDDKKEQ
jgi:flagellin-specific chaperone FliS